MSSLCQIVRTRVAVQFLIFGVIVTTLFVADCGSSTPQTSAPTITSANSAAFTVGAAGWFTVTDSGSPAPTLTESGSLPSGVTFNAATGVLSGTPTAPGTFALTFTAHNGVSTDATQDFTLSVVAAPVATSLTAGVSTITAGSSTTLTAVFSGGTGSVDNGVGTVTSGTPVTVKPSATTT